jgi:hypothetical protein
MSHYYSPHTLELIAANTPASWMASTEVEPPVFDPVTQSCMFQNGAWVVADVVPPAPLVPQAVTRRQAKQALLLAGVLAQVQPAIDAITDSAARAMVQIEWDDSQVFERNRPALIGLAGALGMSPEQLDQLFITASGL